MLVVRDWRFMTAMIKGERHLEKPAVSTHRTIYSTTKKHRGHSVCGVHLPVRLQMVCLIVAAVRREALQRPVGDLEHLAQCKHCRRLAFSVPHARLRRISVIKRPIRWWLLATQRITYGQGIPPQPPVFQDMASGHSQHQTLFE